MTSSLQPIPFDVLRRALENLGLTVTAADAEVQAVIAEALKGNQAALTFFVDRSMMSCGTPSMPISIDRETDLIYPQEQAQIMDTFGFEHSALIMALYRIGSKSKNSAG